MYIYLFLLAICFLLGHMYHFQFIYRSNVLYMYGDQGHFIIKYENPIPSL